MSTTVEVNALPRRLARSMVVVALLVLPLGLAMIPQGGVTKTEAKRVCYLDPGRGMVCQVVK